MFSDHFRFDDAATRDYRSSENDERQLTACLSWLSTRPIEHMVIAVYNENNRLVAIEEVGRGDRTSVCFDPEEVFRRCIILGAASFMLIHNHPVGDAKPSRQDLVLTQRLIARGILLGIACSDAIIVDRKEQVTSLRKAKLIEPWYPKTPWSHHGPAVAKALLGFSRHVSELPEHIRCVVEGQTSKVLLALYANGGRTLIQEISLVTGLSRSATSRCCMGLLAAYLIEPDGVAVEAKNQRYALTREGYSVTERIMGGPVWV